MAVLLGIVGTLLVIFAGIRLFFSVLGSDSEHFIISCIIAAIGIGAIVWAFNL